MPTSQHWARRGTPVEPRPPRANVGATPLPVTCRAGITPQIAAAAALETAAKLASSADEAARLLGAADRLREEIGVPIWGPRLTRFEELVGSVRDALGSDAFAAAWVAGQALDFDAALEVARRVLQRYEVAAGP